MFRIMCWKNLRTDQIKAALIHNCLVCLRKCHLRSTFSSLALSRAHENHLQLFIDVSVQSVLAERILETSKKNPISFSFGLVR